MSAPFVDPATLIVTVHTRAAEVAHPRDPARRLDQLLPVLHNDLPNR